MKTGNGKIANLPSEIREELNRRIDDGQPGSQLVEWLNAKPEVAALMDERFDGRPISEQNLSEWRNRGFQQWLAYRMIIDELRGLSENTEEIDKIGINSEKLLLVLTASYAALIQRWEITPADELTYKMGVLKNLTGAVLALRRSEFQAARLEIARERLELQCEKKRDKSASSSSAPASSSAESAASPAADHPPVAAAPPSSATAKSTPVPAPMPGDPLPAIDSPQPPCRMARQNPPLSPSSRSSRPAESADGHGPDGPASLENASDYFDSLGLTQIQPTKLAA